MALAARVHSALLQAQHRTARSVEPAARRHAVQAGWPVEEAVKIRAHMDKGRFRVSVDGAEDWEYGTQDRPPLAAGRHFEDRTETDVDRVFRAHLGDALRGLI